MGKGFLCLILFCLLPLATAGCRPPTEEDIRERLAREIENIRSYHAFMELRIAGRDSVECYESEQWYRSPRHYRVDVRLPSGLGQRFITDGEVTHIYEEELEEWFQVDHTTEQTPHPPFLLSSYWQGFLNARQVTLMGSEKLESRTYYLLQVIPRDPNSFRDKEIFWLDTRTLMPLRIETYDSQGRLGAELHFWEIVLNPSIDMEVFSVQGAP